MKVARFGRVARMAHDRPASLVYGAASGGNTVGLHKDPLIA